MKDRIAHIMRAKNLKASDFATMIGIQPSAVSHILAGRNNPSLEFVKKVKETFPEYNLDWIIFGTGPMTLSEPYKESFNEAVKTASLFDDDELSDSPAAQNLPSSSAQSNTDLFTQAASQDLSSIPYPESAATTPSPEAKPLEMPFPSSNPDVKSIIVLYKDGTFEAYSPR